MIAFYIPGLPAPPELQSKRKIRGIREDVGLDHHLGVAVLGLECD
jgi:hypothetical protein